MYAYHIFTQDLFTSGLLKHVCFQPKPLNTRQNLRPETDKKRERKKEKRMKTKTETAILLFDKSNYHHKNSVIQDKAGKKITQNPVMFLVFFCFLFFFYVRTVFMKTTKNISSGNYKSCYFLGGGGRNYLVLFHFYFISVV